MLGRTLTLIVPRGRVPYASCLAKTQIGRLLPAVICWSLLVSTWSISRLSPSSRSTNRTMPYPKRLKMAIDCFDWWQRPYAKGSILRTKMPVTRAI